MKTRLASSSVLLACVLATGCFHQVVATGLPAGQTKVVKPWTPTWIFGLVPATPIDVRSQCPNGVALIESKTTFANGLVGALTLGIFTPWNVSVTCSGSGTALNGATRIERSTGTDAAAVDEAVARAMSLSAELGEAVAVDFRGASSLPSIR